MIALTAEEKDKIRELRADNHGYRGIARVIHRAESTVRAFIRAEGLPLPDPKKVRRGPPPGFSSIPEPGFHRKAPRESRKAISTPTPTEAAPATVGHLFGSPIRWWLTCSHGTVVDLCARCK